MASPEMIGLLCAGSTMFHQSGGRGAAGELTRAEMAGLLKGLSSEAMNLALAKWALDEDAERMLLAQVRVWAAGLAIREGWQVVKGRPTICNMAAIAVFEVVRPNRCSRCQGTGMVHARACSACGATGFKPLSGRSVAGAMGIDRESWRVKWLARYEQVYKYVQDVDYSVLNTLNRADRGFNLRDVEKCA